MIHARIENGKVIPLTEADRQKFEAAFPDGNVTLNSDNCPQVADAINRASAEILAQRKDLYRRLADFD